MRSIREKLVLSAVAGTFLLGGSAARAVIVDGANGTGANNVGTATYPVAGMNNVGTIAGSSGVYLGNGWVICASHEAPPANFAAVNGETFIFPDGTTANTDGNVHRLTTGVNSADLVMVHLFPATVGSLSSHSSLLVSSGTPSIGTTIYDIGNGQTRGTATTYNGNGGWNETSPNVMRWGQNITANTNISSVGGPNAASVNVDDGFGITSMFVSQFESNGTEVSVGDSGGGVFSSSNTLLGINIAAFSNDAGQPGNTAIFNNASGYADLSAYAGQINAILPTPEPASLGLVALAGGRLLIRRRARRTAI